MAVKTYNFGQVACSYGGKIIAGFDEGDAIEIEVEADEYTLKMGADGEGSRAKTNNLSAKITLRLQGSSASNDDMNAFLQADRLSGSGALPLLVKDGSGREIHAAETAWIEKTPKSTFGQDNSTREWVLRTDKLVSTYGGN